MSSKATISGWRIAAPRRAAVLTEGAKTGSMPKSPAAAWPMAIPEKMSGKKWPATPTEPEAHLAGQHLEKPRREQRASTEGRPLLRQHLGLGLAGEQGKGEKDPKNSQYRTGNDRLHYDAIAEPCGQLAHGPAEAMKEPAGAGAERNDGKRPGEFGCPHGHGGEVRQPRTAASHLVEQHERPQRPGHGEQVHRRFDRFGNLGRGNHGRSGRAAPMPTPVGIVHIAEQRRRQAEQRAEKIVDRMAAVPAFASSRISPPTKSRSPTQLQSPATTPVKMTSGPMLPPNKSGRSA